MRAAVVVVADMVVLVFVVVGFGIIRFAAMVVLVVSVATVVRMGA